MDALVALAPMLALAVAAAVILIIDQFARGEDADLASFYVAVGAVLLSLFACAALLSREPFEAVARNIRVDAFAGYLGIVIGISALLSICLSYSYVVRLGLDLGDYLALLLLSTAGMQLLVFANELVTLLVGFELMSIPLYVLVGLVRRQRRSAEASVKYLVLGGFASAFLVFGLALLYAVASESVGRGTTVLTDMAHVSLADGEQAPLALLALGMITIGFSFKVGAIPFHQWMPDVYEGAPTALVGFMAAGVKAAAFGAFLRVLLVAFGHPTLTPAVTDLLACLAAVTMLGGNLLALTQTNIKRLLAYSSIGHVGFLLLGVLAATYGAGAGGGGGAGGAATLFYLLVYALTSLGAFAVVTFAVSAGSSGDGALDATREQLSALRGLGRQRPGVGLALTIAMLSLAGMPFTGGFVGKLLVFWAAIEAGYVWLVVLAIAASLLGVYVYLRVIWTIYMVPAESSFPDAPDNWGLSFGLTVAALLTILLGVLPGPFLSWSWAAVASVGLG